MKRGKSFALSTAVLLCSGVFSSATNLIRSNGAGRASRASGLPSIADILLCCREPPLGAMNGLMRCNKNAGVAPSACAPR